jgi:hypothetical protein
MSQVVAPTTATENNDGRMATNDQPKALGTAGTAVALVLIFRNCPGWGGSVWVRRIDSIGG